MKSTDLDSTPTRHGSDPTAPPRARGLLAWVESLAIFALGFFLMRLFYAGSVAQGGEIGVPGHDSFYHVAMASILTKFGAMAEFPWLEYTWFRDHGDAFVSHHWGFHLLLVPFVELAKQTTGDALQGGRWAMSAVFGANLVLFHLLLRHKRVPLHWLWIALFFLLPDQYFSRHGFVRAIGASYLFMQLVLLGLFCRRWWLAGLAVGAYVHLYLGAVMFGPLMVAIHALSLTFGPRDDRELPWKMVTITGAAWCVGVLTYPYAGGIFEFLRLQVLGSGLSPDIEVGREWQPYSDAWFVVKMAGPLLAVWVGSLLLRLRIGPRLTAEELTLVVLQFLFLVLTFKARRFIEYWPPLCLLSAAYIAAEPTSGMLRHGQIWLKERSAPFASRVRGTLLVALALGVAFAFSQIDRSGDAALFLDHWPTWVVPMVVLILAALARDLAGSEARIELPPLIVRSGAFVLTGLLLGSSVLAIGSSSLASAVQQLRCYYDLEAVDAMMTFLAEDSEEGDLIFTDDWDVFPLFFYHNRHNHYIVGLDPKFTHQREPDLWNRYVRISRGQVPGTIRLAGTSGGSDRAPVALEDIRDHFHARYVIADRDHEPLSDALAEAPEFAELVYPVAEDYETARKSTYVVFRIRETNMPPEEAPRTGTVASRLMLGDETPLSVAQGWGDLRANRSVDGNLIRLEGRTFQQGIGTHAPARILYEVPDGYETFAAVVGVDDETGGEGSVIVSVALDGESVYESRRLRGGGGSVVVSIPIHGASQIELRADPTEDGQRFDHVSWAEARLLRETSDGASEEPASSAARPGG